MPTAAATLPNDRKRINQQARNARRGTTAELGYGGNWQKLREIVKHRDPICKWPGCHEPTKDIDHIRRKEDGGDDSESNLQGLCRKHHGVKSRLEQDGETFQPQRITIVCGPPCAGKSTYVATHKRDGDLVFDLDDVIHAISGEHGCTADDDLRLAVVAMRQALLGYLELTNMRRDVWLTHTNKRRAKAIAERLRGRLVELTATREQCEARCHADTARAAERDERLEAIARWFQQA